MRKFIILSIAWLAGINAFAAGSQKIMLDPYSVVVPSINGDPVSTDRVSGQLYFDVSAKKFKGIDNAGAVKTFRTGGGGGAQVLVSGTEVSLSDWTTIEFTSADKVYDVGSYIGTNQFVAQHDGIHLLTSYAVNPAEDTYLFLRFRVNTGDWQEVCRTKGMTGIWGQCGSSNQVYLEAGDTVEFQAYGTSGSLVAERLSIAYLTE